MQSLSVQVKAITIITGYGADQVLLSTCLPSSFPLVSDEPLTLSFSTQAGKGEQYVTETLGLEVKPQVIKRAAL